MRVKRPTRRFSTTTGIIVLVLVVALVAVFVWPGFGTSTGTVSDGAAGGPTAAGSAGPGSGSSGTASSGTASSSDGVSDPQVPIPTPQIAPLTESGTPPTAAGVSARLKKILGDTLAYTGTDKNGDDKKMTAAMSDAVGDLAGVVIDPVTGKTLWKKQAADPRMPASTMKVLTGAALLTWADPGARLVTTVVKGDKPGQIVFVGGGDTTLSAEPEGTPLALPGGPKVADLADQIQAAGGDVTEIVVDTSRWMGPRFADGWQQGDIDDGFVTNMSPLMVDEARLHPESQYSQRDPQPAMQAGKALASALGQPDLPISKGTAPDDAEVIAKVQSQPLSTLLSEALQRSDNTLSEALAREAALAMGAPPSFQGVSIAITQALVELGIDTTGLVVADGAGMSTKDRIPTRILGEVMAAAIAGDHPTLRLLLSGLPLAGVTGTLAEKGRYTQKLTEAGRGWVRAKTGTLGGDDKISLRYALAGYVPDVDGRLLAFAFNSTGATQLETQYAQDALATALRSCGCQA